MSTKADKQHVTLATIAEAVGVSRMTVSNAYNRPDQLSPALRERIPGRGGGVLRVTGGTRERDDRHDGRARGGGGERHACQPPGARSAPVAAMAGGDERRAPDRGGSAGPRPAQPRTSRRSDRPRVPGRPCGAA